MPIPLLMRLRGVRLGRPWDALFAVAALLTLAYVALPYSRTTELLLYDGLVALAVVVSMLAWMRLEKGHRLPWVLSSMALLAFLVGELIWWGYEVAGQDPFPSPADVSFLAGYIPLALAAALLASSREREPDRTAWLDAGILTAVAGLLIWDHLIEPYVGDPSVGGVSLAVTLAYPLADLLVLGLVIRLILSPAARTPAVTMFAVGVVLTLAADLSFAWKDLSGTFSSGSWIDAMWLFGYLFMAFAPLHRGAAESSVVGDTEGMGRGRLIAVMGAVVAPQIVLLFALASEHPLGLDTVTVAVLASMMVMVLVAARLWALLGKARRAEERRGQERVSAFVLHSTDAIFLVDRSGVVSFSSPAAAMLLDASGDVWLGSSIVEAFTEDSRATVAGQLADLAALPTGATLALEGQVRAAGGRTRTVEGTACNLLADDSIKGLVVTLRDVTDRIALEERRGQERLSAFVLHSTDSIFLVDETSRISFSSPAASRLLDTDEDTLLETSIVDTFAEEDREGVARQLANLADMPLGATLPLEGRVRAAGDQTRAVEGTGCNLLADDVVGGLVVTLRDVTDRIALEAQLERRAFQDDLTGLANRALFADRVAHALDRSARDESGHVGVLFIDLDDFKAVNDGMGHGAGDELLRGVATRMRVGLRPADTVARLGGDEFAILLENVSSPEFAYSIATRVLELLSLPIEVAGVSLAVPASVGVTLATEGSTVESLLRDADIAMYRAKAQGKGRIAMFDETLRDVASRRLALKVELPDALRQGQFRLDYQPIVGVADGVIAGFEALIRWHHPVRGLISPGEFIPVAEESGAIVEIGAWVLEEACSQAVKWNERSEHPLSISVNVSAAQLRNPAFPGLLRRVLASTGLPHSLLTIELTESVLIDHVRLAPILGELRAIGVDIAIDDFGTGYSSLSYLQNFPVTSVKVDRSFVSQLTTHGDAGLVRSILALAEALGLSTVAEGVETPGQLEALNSLDCALVQGYYTGYPQSPEEIEALLELGRHSAHRPGGSDGQSTTPAVRPTAPRTDPA